MRKLNILAASMGLILTAVMPAFAQIDPSIPLRSNPVHIQDPTETYRRFQEIRNLQLQNEQIRLQNEAMMRVRETPAPVASSPVFPPSLFKRAVSSPDTASPSNPVEQETMGFCNGRWWLANPETAVRFIFLRGLAEGLRAASDSKVGSLTLPSDLTYGEVVKAVEIFYQDPLNGRLPVMVALQIVKLKAEGGTVLAVDASLEFWRTSVSTDSKKEVVAK